MRFCSSHTCGCGANDGHPQFPNAAWDMGYGSAVAATSSIDVWIQLVDPPKHLILRPLPPSLAHAHNRKSKFNFRCRIFHIVRTKTRLQVLFCASSYFEFCIIVAAELLEAVNQMV